MLGGQHGRGIREIFCRIIRERLRQLLQDGLGIKGSALAMTRRKRFFAFALGTSVVSLLAATAWIGFEGCRDRLDQDLIRALKKQDSTRAIRLLDDGASANAWESMRAPRDWRRSIEHFRDRILGRPFILEKTDRAPAITLVYPDTMAIFTQGERPAEKLSLARALVEHGADVNAPDYRGFTLLHKAAMAKHIATVRYLLEHGAAPNPENDEGRVPLDWSNSEIAELLLSHGADVNHKDASGDTPLVGAVLRNNVPLVTTLLTAHPDINARNNVGTTSLHFALLRAASRCSDSCGAARTDKDVNCCASTTRRHGQYS